MSKEILEYSYREFGNAIILQAVKDYRNALRRLKVNSKNEMAKGELFSIEDFFRGSLYAVLTTLDPEYLIRILRDEGKGKVV